MDPRYGAAYARLYREHWWWRAREEYLTRLLDRLIGPNSAGETFDFGCGDGLFFPILQRYGSERPRGQEYDASLLDPRGPWFDRITTGPLVDDPSERGRYGLIVALDVLEHLEHPEACHGDPPRTPAARRLVCRHRAGVRRALDRTRRGQSSLSPLSGAGHRGPACVSSGLTIVESRYFFVWVAMVKWLVARKERMIRPVVKPPEVPAAPINALALALTRLEQRVLGDAHPAFGSSAIVVAALRGSLLAAA